MRVDQGFVDSVMATTEGRYPHEIIEATLAVAAERGLVVPEDAVKMWAVKNADGSIDCDTIQKKQKLARVRLNSVGETVVRVAVVEVKE